MLEIDDLLDFLTDDSEWTQYVSTIGGLEGEKSGHIYCLHANGEVRYIGQTIKTLAETLGRHTRRARDMWTSHVYNWMRSAGVENVHIMPLSRVPASMLNDAERWWISKITRLTNILPGGQRWGSRKCPPDCKCKKHHCNHVSAVCEQCGVEYSYKPSSNRGRFCSRKCYIVKKKADAASKVVVPKIKKPLGKKCGPGCKCGRHGEKPREASRQRCYARKKPPLTGICEECGVEFIKSRSHPRVRHCSTLCACLHMHRDKGHKMSPR